MRQIKLNFIWVSTLVILNFVGCPSQSDADELPIKSKIEYFQLNPEEKQSAIPLSSATNTFLDNVLIENNIDPTILASAIIDMTLDAIQELRDRSYLDVQQNRLLNQSFSKKHMYGDNFIIHLLTNSQYFETDTYALPIFETVYKRLQRFAHTLDNKHLTLPYIANVMLRLSEGHIELGLSTPNMHRRKIEQLFNRGAIPSGHNSHLYVNPETLGQIKTLMVTYHLTEQEVVDGLITYAYRLLNRNRLVTEKKRWAEKLDKSKNYLNVWYTNSDYTMARILINRMLAAPSGGKKRRVDFIETPSFNKLTELMEYNFQSEVIFFKAITALVSFGVSIHELGERYTFKQLTKIDPIYGMPKLVQLFLLHRIGNPIYPRQKTFKVPLSIANALAYVSKSLQVPTKGILDVLVDYALENSDRQDMKAVIGSRINKEYQSKKRKTLGFQSSKEDTSLYSELDLNGSLVNRFRAEILLYALEVLAIQAPDQLPNLSNYLQNIHCSK